MKRKSKKRTLLLHFVADLLRDRSLQTQCVQKPRAAMKAYGLAGDQIRVLETKDIRRLLDAIGDEIVRYATPIVQTNWKM